MQRRRQNLIQVGENAQDRGRESRMVFDGFRWLGHSWLACFQIETSTLQNLRWFSYPGDLAGKARSQLALRRFAHSLAGSWFPRFPTNRFRPPANLCLAVRPGASVRVFSSKRYRRLESIQRRR